MNAYILLIIYFVIVSCLVGGFLIYRQKYLINDNTTNNNNNQRNNNRNENNRGLDRMRNRLRQRINRTGRGGGGIIDDDNKDGDDDNNNNDDDVDMSQLSKSERKALLKKQRKEQRAAERNYEIEQRNAKSKKQEERDAARRAKEEERERIEAEKAAEEARLAEEKRKKDEEEYLKWKDAFQVDDFGSVDAMTEAESQSLLDDFVNYLKEHKYVELDALAGEFNLRTQEVIDRIKTLESNGRITGVIDDRGKFIYISPEELDQLAKFMNSQGRFTISDVVQEANKVLQF